MSVNGAAKNPYEYTLPKDFGWNVAGVNLGTQRVSVPATTGSEYGISIPHNSSYTYGEDGNTQIAMGQDGIGARHISASERAYMQEQKGLALNLLTLA